MQFTSHLNCVAITFLKIKFKLLKERRQKCFTVILMLLGAFIGIKRRTEANSVLFDNLTLRKLVVTLAYVQNFDSPHKIQAIEMLCVTSHTFGSFLLPEANHGCFGFLQLS
jgi:hypothetical protein